MSGFTFTVIHDPATDLAQTVAGSDAAGTVVGSYDDSTTDVLTGFVENQGSYTLIADPLALTAAYEGTSVEGINDSGTIVGYYDETNADEAGFVDVDGSFTTISDPAAATGPLTGTEVCGINDAGDLSGLYTTADGSAASFVEIGGSFTTIAIPAAVDGVVIVGISADGTVAGNYQTAGGSYQSFTWSNGSVTTLVDPAAGDGSGEGTFVQSINAAGTIAGYAITAQGNAVGFVYDDGTFTAVSDPSAGTATGAGAGTFVTSINAAGELAGYDVTNSQATAGLAQGFVDDAGSFAAIGDPAYSDIITGGTPPLIALNNAGAILESYTDASDESVAVLATLACYLPGTMIRTPSGDVRIETLEPGDMVVTVDGRALPVLHLGRRRADCLHHPTPSYVLPVCVQAGAFGPRLPARDLFLSPDHAIFAEDVLIPIKHLINGTSIRQTDMAEATYLHVALSEHAVILADNLPAESYLDTHDRAAFARGTEARDITLLMDVLGCAPLRVTGPEVERVRALLAVQACALLPQAA
jgi:hypothetical protein